MPMTNEEYVLRRGGCCPFCGSYHLRGRSIQVEGSVAWQEVVCYVCDEEWQDIYTLTGYTQEFN